MVRARHARGGVCTGAMDGCLRLPADTLDRRTICVGATHLRGGPCHGFRRERSGEPAGGVDHIADHGGRQRSVSRNSAIAWMAGDPQTTAYVDTHLHEAQSVQWSRSPGRIVVRVPGCLAAGRLRMHHGGATLGRRARCGYRSAGAALYRRHDLCRQGHVADADDRDATLAVGNLGRAEAQPSVMRTYCRASWP